MKKVSLILLLLSVFALESHAQSITRLIGASPFQDSVWVFDTSNFSVVKRYAPTPNTGGPFNGTNGITQDPVTGTIYMVSKQSAVSGRVLGKLNPLTGVVTIVGNLGDNFSSITMTTDEKMYGATGDGASVPETLYQIDTTTAAKRLVKTMGNGADGEVICYNPDDNMLYHWSGNTTIVLEKIDTVTGPYNFTNIPISGTTNGETFGMVYRGNGVFIGSNISSRFQLWGTNGTVYAPYGNSAPDDIRGTVFLTCPRTVTAASSSFCSNSSDLLTAAAGSSSYQWYLDGTLIAGATSQTYAATQGGHYNVMFNDGCGMDSSGTGVNITRNNAPVVSVTGTSAICAGDSTLLTGTSGGTSQWYMNGQVIPGATSHTYYASAAGVYNMTKTNLNGCSDSAATGITLTVNPVPVVNLGNDTTVCAMLTLDAQNAGSTYLWNDATSNQTLTVTASGAYDVTVTNSFSCISRDTILVTVNPLPVVNLGPDVTSCGSATLDAGNPGATYVWCDLSTAQTIILTSSGTCAVIVTDPNGCSNSDTINVTINPVPVVTASSAADSLCVNDPPVPLSGMPSGGTFSGPGVAGVTFMPSVAGAGAQQVIYMYTDSTTGCSNSDSLTIVVNPLPVVQLTAASNTVCIDDAAVTLTGSPAGGTYSGPGVTGASFNPAVAGLGTHSITYSYSDPNGCSDFTTINITVSACVGIAEHAMQNGTTLFPNPSSGQVQITVQTTSTVTIFNSVGQIVTNVQLENGTHSLDLSELPNGIYTVRTENAKGASQQRLVISK